MHGRERSGIVEHHAIDEALAGWCDDIKVIIHPDNSISISDNGRGIPVGVKFDDKHEPKRSAAEIVLTVLHAGAVLSEGSVAQVQADPKVQEVYLGTGTTTDPSAERPNPPATEVSRAELAPEVSR